MPTFYSLSSFKYNHYKNIEKGDGKQAFSSVKNKNIKSFIFLNCKTHRILNGVINLPL